MIYVYKISIFKWHYDILKFRYNIENSLKKTQLKEKMKKI